MNIRTRMAPSPTGLLHIGTVHTALFNYLLAKKNKGTFILRMDDTDEKRSKEEYEEDIINNLHWLGIFEDEGPDTGGNYSPYRQSYRKSIYQKYIQQLINDHYAYRCFCTQEEIDTEKQTAKKQGHQVYHYSGKCKRLSLKEIEHKVSNKTPFTIRMRTDFVKNTITIHDQIRGEVSINANEIGDFIIVRSDHSPLLILTATVDDIEMNITHAIRGEDMLNASFRMYYIYKALNKEIPKYAHKPFLYAQDGSKLSKRHGATSIEEFKQQGYIPEAILNYLFFSGYTPLNDQQAIYNLEQMIEDFDFTHFQKGMPKFDYQKLAWYNTQYIKSLPIKRLLELIPAFTPEKGNLKKTKKILPLVQERMNTLADFMTLTDFFFKTSVDTPKTGWKPDAIKHLEQALQTIEKTTHWNYQDLNQEFLKLIKTNNWKTGHFFMNLRIAVTGKKITPPITESIIILGKQQTFNNIKKAIQVLK